jgi:hypothetical protein
VLLSATSSGSSKRGGDEFAPGTSVRTHHEDRAEMLAAIPIYHVTDRDVGYTVVLIRLSRIDPGVSRDLLGRAYKFVSGIVAPRSLARKRPKRC